MGIRNSKRCKAMKMTETGNTMPELEIKRLKIG